MKKNKTIDDIIARGYDSKMSPHHIKVTVIDFEKSNIYRKASLKKYNLIRYILNQPPKPISRILILKKSEK